MIPKFEFKDVVLNVGGNNYNMGSNESIVVDGLIDGTSYPVTVSYSVLDPDTSKYYTNTIELDSVTTLEFEVPTISEFYIYKELNEGKITFKYKVIDEDDFAVMKDGAILTNAGHFDCEVYMAGLREMAVESKEMRKNIIGYKLSNGNWINVLGEGRLVNLACGDGHPAEIMDMSFAIQALSAKYLVEHQGQMDSMLIDVPTDVDMDVATRKLEFLGKKIDTLTDEQRAYLDASL